MKRLTITQFTDKVIENNLRSWAEQFSPEDIQKGLDWYPSAQAFALELASKYGLEPYTVASVISALSPNNKWDRNKIDAATVIEAWSKGLSADDVTVCTYHDNKYKAFNILNGSWIAESSPKTHAFSMNVGNLSKDHITIDLWHLRASMSKPHTLVPRKDKYSTSITAKQYRRVERITAKLAKELGYNGLDFQAIIWVTAQRIWDTKKAKK